VIYARRQSLAFAAVVGIDVGGPRKGFHAVALRDGSYFDRSASCSAQEISNWCNELDAGVVAVDAPCRWRTGEPARRCERELLDEHISCYWTPSRERAEGHAFYQWMLNGAALYRLLEERFPLANGDYGSGRVCIETFPHAVACALAGRPVSAKKKREVRLEVLRGTGLDTSGLRNIDYIDAALCALAALHMQRGTHKAFGEASDGFIVVPR
jgi:predicted nuclease with RNAse H fold